MVFYPGIHVRDQDWFEKFRKLSGTVINEYDGHVLVRSAQVDQREGEEDFTDVIILEFPNIEAARRFYESDGYQSAIKVRQQAADTSLFLVGGL